MGTIKMEFTKTVQISGDKDKYTISPEIKKYALLDLGFEQTKRGNFEYLGSLDTDNPFKPVARLRILINSDLDGLKMETLSGNGLRKINIFNHQRAAEFVQQYHYILDEMVARQIFTK
ncbi:cysteine desulfurase [Limosilactobacillus reuteri]|uniref:Cysteine desulfurase n=2 Tax=Lactobacillaceae TaxID=33958 RepID=A0A2S1EQ90_LIMRT|nr:cysteine desulfurase [Limosilactobacillus reuteri]